MEVPPLRNHPDDIKPIALHHTARFCDNYGIEMKGFSSDFFNALSSYDWPGNVRELVNSLESAISVAQHEPILFPKHLPPAIRVHLAKSLIANRWEPSVQSETGENPRHTVRSLPIEVFAKQRCSKQKKGIFKIL